MSIGATTIRSPGPGEASAEHAAVEVDDLAAAGPRVRRIVRRLAPWLAATTNAVFSSARQRFTIVHQFIGSVAPQGSM